MPVGRTLAPYASAVLPIRLTKPAFSTVHPSLRAAAFALWRRSNPLLTRRLLRAKEHRPRNDEIYSCLYGRENHTIIFFSILKAVFYFRVGNDRDSESIIGSV